MKRRNNNAYHRLRIALLFCLLFSLHPKLLAGENPRIGFSEFCWAAAHPFKAAKALKISKRAGFLTDSLVREHNISRLNDGQADALKHCIWMALLSMEMDSVAALRLGYAHENVNIRQFKKGSFRHDSTARCMDLYNNQQGVKLAQQCSTEDEICTLAVKWLYSGKLFIIARNNEGTFVDSQGQTLVWPPETLVWNSGRSLTSSEATKK